jgi:catechol 2,3-dioxygenase-like lactoylglutathione lyase family enzyme
MIRTGKLHHASIRIGDLERSRKFYERLLGLSQAARPDLGFPGVWYALGEGQLHLIEIPKYGEGGIDPSDPHFAIEIDDVEGTKQALDDAGIVYVSFAGGIWIKDPDGYTVELRLRGS